MTSIRTCPWSCIRRGDTHTTSKSSAACLGCWAVVSSGRRLGPRLDSILWWLHMNPQFGSYRILDDDVREFPTPPPPELILCDPKTGVAAPAVLAAIRQWLEE